MAGLTARTTGTGSSGSDMYFAVDADTAATGHYDATLRLSYFDSGTGAMTVQYDAGANDPYHTAGTVALTDSRTWKTATVAIQGAYFGGLENAGADLRVHAAGAVTVHSAGLTVTGPWVPTKRAFPPIPTITAPVGGGTVKFAAPVSGATVPNGAVTAYEGSTALCTATADDNGAWSCGPDGGFTAGHHTVSATSTDAGGLNSDASPGTAFTASDLPPGTATVGAVLGAANHAYGMSEDETPSSGFDGPTNASVIAGLSARTSTQGNIYFNIDDTVAHAGYYTATFTVSYYDQGTGSFSVQYDNGTSDPYESTANIPLTGTNTWKSATVSASDAYVGGQQHSAADFRLRNGSGQVTVHSVAVKVSGSGVPDTTPFAPAVVLAAPLTGAVVGANPTVSGTAEPDATVTVTAEGAQLCATTAADDGSWSCAASGALSTGAHTLTATAQDATATPSIAASVQVTVG